MLFSSGAEHLHQAQRVTAGTRFVLASWYTLSAAHGRPIPTAEGLFAQYGSTEDGEDEDGEEEELMDVQAMLDAKISELQKDLQRANR